MKFGFLKFLLFALFVLAAGSFAYLALTDVPVVQEDVTIDIPASVAEQN